MPWFLHDIFLNVEHILVSVEDAVSEASALLREGLVLQFAFVVQSFVNGQFFGVVVVVSLVADDASERGLLSNLAHLDWIRQEVAWPDEDTTLLVSEVLLHVESVGLVLVGSRVVKFLGLRVDPVLFVHRCDGSHVGLPSGYVVLELVGFAIAVVRH